MMKERWREDDNDGGGGEREKIRPNWGRRLVDRHNVTGVRHFPESAAAGVGYTLAHIPFHRFLC